MLAYVDATLLAWRLWGLFGRALRPLERRLRLLRNPQTTKNDGLRHGVLIGGMAAKVCKLKGRLSRNCAVRRLRSDPEGTPTTKNDGLPYGGRSLAVSDPFGARRRGVLVRLKGGCSQDWLPHDWQRHIILALMGGRLAHKRPDSRCYASAHCCFKYLSARPSAASGLSDALLSTVSHPE